MNQLLKIDNVLYRVNDLGRSARFYEQVLKLKRAWTDEERSMIGYRLAESESELVIHADSELPDFDYSFSVENVKELCDDYEQMGYQVVLGPIEVRCGQYAVLADPDGNKIPIIDLTKFGGKPIYD